MPHQLVKLHSQCPWTKVRGIETIAEARLMALSAATGMVLEAPVANLTDRLHILAESTLPPDGSEPTPFLALHFDRGHPLFSQHLTPLYLVTGLYRPITAPPSDAFTRLVSLQQLLRQRRWGDVATIEARLGVYARSHGSSWDWDGDSGHRVSCFARILDAVDDTAPRLTNFREIPKKDWCSASNGGHEFRNLDDEERFYASCGATIDCEERLLLEPGELLLIDNVRAIHGRLGARLPRELYQFLIGVKACRPPDATRIRAWLVALLTGKHSN